MRTLNEVLERAVEMVANGGGALDGRDIQRLAAFVPEAELPRLGLQPKPEFVGKWEHEPLTREAVMEMLTKDLAFAFEKALDKRGISASCMYSVIQMWNWVLDEGLENFNEYAHYGLPLFKATALKYDLPNPIGEDSGAETKYSDAA